MDEDKIPTEPPVGTWVLDRFGGASLRHENGGWAEPGFMPYGVWKAMWKARGPLVECSPWGTQERIAADVAKSAEAERAVEDLVPTTDEVRDIWVDYYLNHLPRADGIALVPRYQAAFDRWLPQ